MTTCLTTCINCEIDKFETGGLPFWVVVMIANNHRLQSDKSGKAVEKFCSRNKVFIVVTCLGRLLIRAKREYHLLLRYHAFV